MNDPFLDLPAVFPPPNRTPVIIEVVSTSDPVSSVSKLYCLLRLSVRASVSCFPLMLRGNVNYYASITFT